MNYKDYSPGLRYYLALEYICSTRCQRASDELDDIHDSMDRTWHDLSDAERQWLNDRGEINGD